MLPDHLSDVRNAAETEGLDHPLMAKLSDTLVERAKRCRKIIDSGAATASEN